MYSKTLEIWVGLFAALSFAALLMLAMKVSNLAGFYEDEGYEVGGYFGNIGGLKLKAPVTMAGVRIGRVVDIQFDIERFEALVKMKIDAKYAKIPEDTGAAIFTSGLLGDKYIGLEAGGEEEYLADGSMLEMTQSALILEQLVGKLLYDKAEGGN
ncbi:MAG: outer membrane lipid asymmetry maintenance protein MlaD [Gammaproteobacteria bacterium]|nr:outer membrane lipid asymmetry maintenance protein MlaD [Gammaproteobacteria bacterium]